MAKCHLSWDSYKKNICNGFSHLQQQEEFVDMTLAAEGHLVKVHKTLLALASPYLKEVIKTAPCQHPVIFLTHISHEILGYIVEYVYTGEAVVPSHKMDDFVEAGKALHIIGIENLIPPTKLQGIPGIPIQQRLEAEKGYFRENNTTLVHHVNKNLTAAGFEAQTGQMPDLSRNEYSLVNTDDCTRSANQENNLITQSFLNSEDLLEESHAQQLTSQNCENVTYSSQYEKFLNPTTSKLKLTPITQSDVPSINQTKKPCADTSTRNIIVSESMAHAVEEDVESDNDVFNNMDNMDIESQDVKYELIEVSEPVQASMASENQEDYCINVEMPNGDTGPPKITIQAAVMENATRDTNPPNVTQSNVSKNPSVSNTIPTITINAGMIQDVPSFSISRDSCPIEGGKSMESVIGSNATTPLYIISGKGCLQMILNRYIYGVHHQSKRGRRWRCIDYRHKRCPAYIDTIGDKIVSRKFLHHHPFHDDKIMSKGSRKQVFESLEEVSKVYEKFHHSA